MKRGIGFLIIATLLWGGNYICGRFLASALPPTLLNTIRWIISSMLLVSMASMNHKRIPVFTKWKEFMILGFLGIFSFSTLTYLGLGNVSASEAGMISAGIPIAILAFTPFFLRDSVKKRAWIGAVISVFGVIVLMSGKHAGQAHSRAIGDLEIVLACLAWGLYTVLGKRYGKEIDSLTMTAGAALYGSIFSAISCIGTVRSSSIHMSALAWASILYVSTFASVIAYLAWNTGVKIVGTGRAAPYINLLPVWTVLFGIALLHEHISWLSFAGGIITIAGAFLASI